MPGHKCPDIYVVDIHVWTNMYGHMGLRNGWFVTTDDHKSITGSKIHTICWRLVPKTVKTNPIWLDIGPKRGHQKSKNKKIINGRGQEAGPGPNVNGRGQGAGPGPNVNGRGQGSGPGPRLNKINPTWSK